MPGLDNILACNKGRRIRPGSSAPEEVHIGEYWEHDTSDRRVGNTQYFQLKLEQQTAAPYFWRPSLRLLGSNNGNPSTEYQLPSLAGI